MEEEKQKKKKADLSKLKEAEQMYIDNEKLSNSLAFIQQNYDLDTLDDKMRSAKKTEEWAEQFMTDLKIFFNVFENVMTCNICDNTLDKETAIHPPVMVLPCMHFFCYDCHRGKRTD